VKMLIQYFRSGRSFCVGEGPSADSIFTTRVLSTGTAQKQLLLDYEEDKICVVRHVCREGKIGGRRLWPSAEPEVYTGREDDCA